MITIPLHTNPPRWMQAAVSSLLPPAYREPVLGDLQERFAERSARARWPGYVHDVVTTVPHVVWGQMRRTFRGGPARALARPGDLRTRAEHLQTQVWLRNAAMLISVVVIVGAFLLNARGAWRFHESVNLAMTIGWICATWSYGVRGRSALIPSSLSADELRAFHRREVTRQRDLGCREFVYWTAPAVLLILYALAVEIPGFRGGVMLLGALALQNLAMAWAHWRERRRLQQELDWLDQVEPA